MDIASRHVTRKPDQQRVAIRHGLGRGRGANQHAATGTVFDHESLAERRDHTRLNSRRFNRLDSYAPKTKRVPTAERITLLGSSARTKS
jgi:hypothetical protein